MTERLLRPRCTECGHDFIVKERDVDDFPLACPFCTAQVDINEEPEEDGDEPDDELGDDENEEYAAEEDQTESG